MNSAVGINVHKELNSLMKKVKIPSRTHTNYYTYNYDGEPSYKAYDNIYDTNKADSCCIDSCLEKLEIDKKTVAIIGVGLIVGILGICLVRKNKE